MIDCCFRSLWKIFWHYGDITIASKALQLIRVYICLAPMVFEQGRDSIMPHLLWHGTLVFAASCKGPIQFRHLLWQAFLRTCSNRDHHVILVLLWVPRIQKWLYLNPQHQRKHNLELLNNSCSFIFGLPTLSNIKVIISLLMPMDWLNKSLNHKQKHITEFNLLVSKLVKYGQTNQWV